ncbi:MAG: acyl carrier protein [Phycisphaerae bacterium]|nr:acyl carrier protein [Phycisphaerae bacterium]
MPETYPTADLTQRVIELAAAQVETDPAQVTRDTHLFNDLGYDSLDAVEFAMQLEDAFDVTIPDDDADKVKTVGDAIDALMAGMAR